MAVSYTHLDVYKRQIRTLTVKQFYFFGQYRADYGMAFAAALLSMVPVLLSLIHIWRCCRPTA